VYTRYADDLVISGSGDFARNVERYAAQAAAIALSEGWSVQHHKTRMMRRSVRQQLAGIVVTQEAALPFLPAWGRRNAGVTYFAALAGRCRGRSMLPTSS